MCESGYGDLRGPEGGVSQGSAQGPEGLLQHSSVSLSPTYDGLSMSRHGGSKDGVRLLIQIYSIRRIILASIEDPYSMEQLKEPRLNVLIVKPLVERLYDEDDVSLGRCPLSSRNARK